MQTAHASFKAQIRPAHSPAQCCANLGSPWHHTAGHPLQRLRGRQAGCRCCLCGMSVHVCMCVTTTCTLGESGRRGRQRPTYSTMHAHVHSQIPDSTTSVINLSVCSSHAAATRIRLVFCNDCWSGTLLCSRVLGRIIESSEAST